MLGGRQWLARHVQPYLGSPSPFLAPRKLEVPKPTNPDPSPSELARAQKENDSEPDGGRAFMPLQGGLELGSVLSELN